MNQKDKDEVINTIIQQISAALHKSKDEIAQAYETLFDEGGLPISIGVKLQGNLDTMKSIYNLSFPKDKFKITLKETIDLKQQSIDFKKESEPESETAETEDQAPPVESEDPYGSAPAEDQADPDPVPPATENPSEMIVEVGRSVKVAVGAKKDGDQWTWYSELTLPSGGEDIQGGWDASDKFDTIELAQAAGINHALTLIDGALSDKKFAGSAKSNVNKGRGQLVELLEQLAS